MCVSVCPPSDRQRAAVPLIECARAPNGDSCALPRAHAARVGSSLPLAACHSDSVTLCWRYLFFYWVCWAGCALAGVGISCGHDAATVTCAATCVRVLTRDVCLYGETGVRRARRWTLALAARKARPGRAARVTFLCRCCARLSCVMAAESVWWRPRVRVVCSAVLAVCGEHARNRVLRVRLRCHTALWRRRRGASCVRFEWCAGLCCHRGAWGTRDVRN